MSHWNEVFSKHASTAEVQVWENSSLASGRLIYCSFIYMNTVFFSFESPRTMTFVYFNDQKWRGFFPFAKIEMPKLVNNTTQRSTCFLKERGTWERRREIRPISLSFLGWEIKTPERRPRNPSHLKCCPNDLRQRQIRIFPPVGCSGKVLRSRFAHWRKRTAEPAVADHSAASARTLNFGAASAGELWVRPLRAPSPKACLHRCSGRRWRRWTESPGKWRSERVRAGWSLPCRPRWLPPHVGGAGTCARTVKPPSVPQRKRGAPGEVLMRVQCSRRGSFAPRAAQLGGCPSLQLPARRARPSSGCPTGADWPSHWPSRKAEPDRQ